MSADSTLRRVAPGAALTALGLALLPATLQAQGTAPPGMLASGPRIEAGGPTFQVDAPTFAVPDDHVFRAVFEIVEGDAEGTRVNPDLTTLARFLNLHARHGVPDERVHTAAVVHGGGWAALLTDDAYGARFEGKANPTRGLVEELLAEGMPIVLCGQTAGAHGVERSELLAGVEVALSAMTALNTFYARGFGLNPW